MAESAQRSTRPGTADAKQEPRQNHSIWSMEYIRKKCHDPPGDVNVALCVNNAIYRLEWHSWDKHRHHTGLKTITNSWLGAQGNASTGDGISVRGEQTNICRL